MDLTKIWTDYSRNLEFGAISLYNPSSFLSRYPRAFDIMKTNRVSLVDQPAFGFPYRAACMNAEGYNRKILTPSHRLYRRGYVLVHDDVPLGHLKLKASPTFLAWQTVKNGHTYPLVKGGIYALQKELVDDLRGVRIQEKQWGVAEMFSFELLPLRPMRESLLKSIWHDSTLDQLIDRERERWYKEH